DHGVQYLGLGRTEIRHGGPRANGDVDGTVGEGGDADDRRRRLQDAGVGGQNLADRGEHFRQVAAVAHADREAELPDFAVVVEDFTHDFAIGDDDLGQV